MLRGIQGSSLLSLWCRGRGWCGGGRGWGFLVYCIWRGLCFFIFVFVLFLFCFVSYLLLFLDLILFVHFHFLSFSRPKSQKTDLERLEDLAASPITRSYYNTLISTTVEALFGYLAEESGIFSSFSFSFFFSFSFSFLFFFFCFFLFFLTFSFPSSHKKKNRG